MRVLIYDRMYEGKAIRFVNEHKLNWSWDDKGNIKIKDITFKQRESLKSLCVQNDNGLWYQ